MRILFLTSYVDPGSGASVLIRLAEQLMSEGHHVRILTTTAGFDSDIIQSVILRPVFESINTIINKIVPDYFSLKYQQLLREITCFGPDVINVHWTHGQAIPLKIIPRLVCKWPVFWTIHDLWPITAGTFFEYSGGQALKMHDASIRRKKLSFRFRPNVLLRYKIRLLRDVRIHTISPSRWMERKVAASPVFQSAINHHVPNGVDTKVFRPLDRKQLRARYGIPDEARVILFLSANLADTRKGIYYFSKALQILKESAPCLLDNVITLLIGRNSDGVDKYIPTEVRNLGRTREVLKLVEFYNLADLFVSASLADNFPSTSLESLACGTPVVAFDVGGVSEIVKDKETGLLVRCGDAEDLAEKVKMIVGDTRFQDELSAEGRAHAVSLFDIARFAGSYVGLFEQAQSGDLCHSKRNEVTANGWSRRA